MKNTMASNQDHYLSFPFSVLYMHVIDPEIFGRI